MKRSKPLNIDIMLALKLAYKNLMGAGLRTWLNVSVLSFAFVVIIFYNGMIDGWNRQAREDTREWETGAGQLWHPEYDRYDPYTFEDAHAPMNANIQELVLEDVLVPVLVEQATMYPQGRMKSVVMKGIRAGQKILKLPTASLNDADNAVFIGKRMAETARIKVGETLLVRWRDKNGTFDARELYVAKVFDSNVPSVDNGQLWLSLNLLQEMTGKTNEATYLVASESYNQKDVGIWEFKDLDFLLADLDAIIQSKKGGGMVGYLLLLIIALLAIFDSQVLSIFRRQKEIGTYIALGVTRLQVVKIFTVEGSAHSILAALLGAAYGIPLFLWLDTKGLSFSIAKDTGITMADTIYPYYSMGLIVSTILLVVISSTIVSYIPARKIAKMKPTDAIKGKLQ
ncbi:MAG: ABC transporter permease [bacterium]